MHRKAYLGSMGNMAVCIAWVNCAVWAYWDGNSIYTGRSLRY